MKRFFLIALAPCAVVTLATAQTYSLDFNDPTWTNDTSGLSSEFQTNGGTSGNFAGWDSTHSVASVGRSGVGATLSINHKVHAWNMINRPSQATYFPSTYGADGDVLRAWNNTSNLSSGQIPAFSLQFTEEVSLFSFGLEGFRHDDAWQVTAYDMLGQVVAPRWRNPNLVSFTNPGAELGNTAINILTTTGVNGATGAEALGAGRYDSTDKSFVIWNANNAFERGSAVIDYNGANVQTVLFEMIEVDTTNGIFTGQAADQSMYLGSGMKFNAVPEPSTVLLSTCVLGLLLIRRRRA
ncbi:MAG: PEP-CTERM sorting domain-containing protein [Luteolibacter sp.]